MIERRGLMQMFDQLIYVVPQAIVIIDWFFNRTLMRLIKMMD